MPFLNVNPSNHHKHKWEDFFPQKPLNSLENALVRILDDTSNEVMLRQY